MNIRLEQPEDYREVEELTREAFWNVYRPGCTEHFVLNQYRNNPDFIPELDFVMEEDNKIIGHVMFSKAELVLDDDTRRPSWTFGPISIHPDYKRKGYGLKLLNYALEKAREMGIGFLCMEGDIEFYKHAGFDLASKLGIHYHSEPRDAEVPYFLAQELIPGWLDGIEATYSPPQGYFVADKNPEAFEAYEATFPKKEKLRLPGQLTYDGTMENDRIVLRPWRENDAETLFKYASDPEVGSRAGWAPHKSVEESLEIIRTIFNNDTTWAIVLKETNKSNEQSDECITDSEPQEQQEQQYPGEPIGAIGYGPSCDCNLPAREGEPLAGYWVAKPYWNQGICTEAMMLMIEHIKKTTNLKSIISGHFIDNPASGRVMEKCGFVPTGETCIDPSQFQGEDRPIRVMRLELETENENANETPKESGKSKVFKYLFNKNKRAVLKRAFHLWQLKPHVVAPLSDAIHQCSSCGTEYQGNYCPRCGQSATVGRFSFKRTFLHFLDVWGMGNRGMFRTIRDLALRPGYMIRDYLRGMQSAYFPPFKMFFVLLAISLFLEHGFDFDHEATSDQTTKHMTEFIQQANNKVQNISNKEQTSTTSAKGKKIHESKMYSVGTKFANLLKVLKERNPAIFSLLSLLLFSWPMFFFLRRSPNIPDLRFSEFIIALVYTANSYSIFSILRKLLNWGLFDLIALLMIFVALHQFSGYKKRRIFGYMTLSLFISVITIIAIGAACIGITYLFVSQ